MATWNRLSGRSTYSTQTATDSAPTSSEDGLNLADLNGFALTLAADSGQTLTGVGGALQAYFYDDSVGFWARAPELDLNVQTGSVGTRACTFTGFQVSHPRGRLAHICNGISVSGGNLTVTYSCSGLYGDRT